MPGKTEVDNFQSTRLRPYSGGRNPLSGDDIGKRSREVVHPQVNIVAIIAKHLQSFERSAFLCVFLNQINWYPSFNVPTALLAVSALLKAGSLHLQTLMTQRSFGAMKL